MKTSRKRNFPKIRFFFLFSFVILRMPCHSQNRFEHQKASFDPICQDVIVEDSILPGVEVYSFDSEGSNLKFLEFFPTGKGPHPTLIMLQGFTAMGGNTDVAAAINRAGWNVIFFRYRGS